MNSPAAKTPPKAAPEARPSWAYAEDFVGETEAATDARSKADRAGRHAARPRLGSRPHLAGPRGPGQGGRGDRHRLGRVRAGALRRDAARRHPDQRRHRGRTPAGGAEVVPGGRDPDAALPADRRCRAERAPPPERRRLRPGVHRRGQGRVRRVRGAGHPAAAARRACSRWTTRCGTTVRPTRANTDEETEAIRTALAAVKANDDLVSALLPVGDGLLVAVKR